MHGNAQLNLFTQTNIVWNVLLRLKVILLLVSHKNSLVGAIEHFVNYPSTLPDHWRWGGELDGETISYRLRYKTDPSRRRHRHKTWLEISRECVMARWRVWLLNQTYKRAGSDGADRQRKAGEMRPFKLSASHCGCVCVSGLSCEKVCTATFACLRLTACRNVSVWHMRVRVCVNMFVVFCGGL